MDWHNRDVVRQPLTMLVVDIRNSSTFFRDTHPDQQFRFLREFSQRVATSVTSITRGNDAEAYVDKFTGDGFLILFDEPTPRATVKLGPARALSTALAIRRRLKALLRTWPEQFAARSDVGRLGVVAGIVYGEALFGLMTDPANSQPTVILEPVVKAFRYAQVRDRPGLAQADSILICLDTYREVRGFIDSDQVDAHPELFIDVTDARFHPFHPGALKGVRDPRCMQVAWGDDPDPPRALTRWARMPGVYWRRLRG